MYPTRYLTALTNLGCIQNLPSAPRRGLSGFGLEYEQVIDTARARRLLGATPLPGINHETVLHRTIVGEVGRRLASKLALQNVGGVLVLASSTHTTNQWPAVFGIKP